MLGLKVAGASSVLFLLTNVKAFFPVHPLQAPAAAASRCVKGSRTRSSFELRATTSNPGTVQEAKADLKHALEASRGSTLVDNVQAAAEALAGFNPSSAPAKAWPIHCGEWISIGEDFKGTTRTAEGLECTLGRLVFNIFEPVNLPVRLTEIRNIIGSRPDSVDPADKSPYRICTRWEARDGSGLKGRVQLKGACWEDPSKPDRLLLQFLEGTIEPDETPDLDVWRKVIGVADAEETAKKGQLSRLKEGAARLMLKVFFGFKGPADTQGSRGELSYEMKRAPKGYLDILYLDEEMRVTRGNQGSLVVVTRA